MHILIATGLYPPDVGGPATFSYTLKNELPKRGIAVTVVSFGEVRRLPRIVRHIAYFFLLLARGRKADEIFAQDPVSVGLPALFASKVLRKRFILKIVGDYAWEQWMQKKKKSDPFITPDTFQEKHYGGVLTRLQRFVEHQVARRADIIVVPSQYLKTIVSAWGVNEKNIRVVYNGFRVPHEEGPKQALRALLGVTGPLCISAGRLVPWKGFRTLIECMPRLLQDFPDATLVIAGSGPDAEELDALIRARGLESTVSLAGPLERETLLKYIEASDIFVLNTAYEGFSHVLLEVMALGTPIITTAVGGNPEALRHRKEGLLVSFNDKKALEKALIQLLTQTTFAQNLGVRARGRARQFSEEAMLSHLIHALEWTTHKHNQPKHP